MALSIASQGVSGTALAASPAGTVFQDASTRAGTSLAPASPQPAALVSTSATGSGPGWSADVQANDVLTHTAAGVGTARPRLSSRGADARPSSEPSAAASAGRPAAALTIPRRLQRDGSAYAEGNCGVAALAMIFEANGIDQPTAALRERANVLQPPVTFSDGLALETLAGVAKQFGFTTRGVYDGKAYRKWTGDELRAELSQGNPVIFLVDYASLPLNSGSRAQTGHYIVLTGYEGQTFVYNDSLPRGGTGLGDRIEESDLFEASDAAWPPRSAMALLSPAQVAKAKAASAGSVPPEGVARDPGRWYSRELAAGPLSLVAIATPRQDAAAQPAQVEEPRQPEIAQPAPVDPPLPAAMEPVLSPAPAQGTPERAGAPMDLATAALATLLATGGIVLFWRSRHRGAGL